MSSNTPVRSATSLRASSNRSPYSFSQESFASPSLPNRSLGSFKILKYSFIHDTRPTKNGLSSQPIDPFEWSHQVGATFCLRIYRSEQETDNTISSCPSNARIVVTVTKGYAPKTLESLVCI